MRRIDYYDVDRSLYQRFDTCKHICRDAYRTAAQKSALCILCCERIFDLFLDIFDGDKAFEIKILINDGKFFLARCGKDLFGLFKCDAFACRDQIFGCHAIFDLLRKICLKFEITVGDDTYELAALGDGNTGDAVLAHEVVGIFKGMLGGKKKRICNDAVLRTFYFIDFLRLFFDRHVFVDDSDSALSGHGNCHEILGDRIHPCAHHRDIQPDRTGKICRNIDLIRNDL